MVEAPPGAGRAVPVPVAHDFEMLDRYIQAEAVDPYDLDLRGFLHTLGIEKGGTFDPGQAWINTFAGENTEFQSSSTDTNLEQRTGFFTSAYSDSPGMVVNVVGKGAKYPATMKDANGDWLDGCKSYSLRLPPDLPRRCSGRSRCLTT